MKIRKRGRKSQQKLKEKVVKGNEIKRSEKKTKKWKNSNEVNS